MARRKRKPQAEPPEPASKATEPGAVDTAPATIAAPAELMTDAAQTGEAIAPTDPLTRYLTEVRRYPRLTREEEHQLAVRYREAGDREAAQRLATGNLRLVVRIAMDYRRAYLNLLDLIQEGNIGLLQAIRKYDPYRGVPFSAYAGYWIRAYMLKHLLDHWSLVRFGTTNVRRKLFYNLKREQERLRREGLDPGPKLLAQSLGVEESEIVEVSRALKGRDVSLDQPVGKPGGEDDRSMWETMAADVVAPDEQAARGQMQAILRDKIAGFASALKDKERYILENRLLAEEPMTLQAIGDHFGTTREAVRQTEARLIQRLKEHLKREIKDLRHFEVKPE